MPETPSDLRKSNRLLPTRCEYGVIDGTGRRCEFSKDDHPDRHSFDVVGQPLKPAVPVPKFGQLTRAELVEADPTDQVFSWCGHCEDICGDAAATLTKEDPE
jgi:hypothetical protein